MMPQIQDWLSSYTAEPGKIAVLVNAMGASEFWGQNVNGDIFPENALVHDCRNHGGVDHPYDDFTGKVVPPYGYWTFLDAHPFVHHKNKDPNRAFGKVVVATWNPRMHRVELVIIIDKELALQNGAQHVVDRILAGEFPDVSMGCKVPYDVCTICGHKSKTRHDYCTCITQFGMGKLLDDGRRVGVINTYPRFFDISFVFIGADKTAKVMCKLASGLYVPLSVFEGEEIYGIDPDEALVKAASAPPMPQPTPDNLYELYTHAPPPSLLFGKTDAQNAAFKRAISDGTLRTNADVNETEGSEEEKESPLYPSRGKTAASRQGQVMEFYTTKSKLPELWKKAKNISIGPPPKPNRKEHPFVGTIDFRGMMIHVENKPGDVREGKGWKTQMKLPYGEFLGTKGVDKDKLDVYVGPYRNAPNVYIVHQNVAFGPRKGKYDEDKVMLGFESAEQAKQAYLAHYDNPNFFRSITTMAFPLFKRAIMKKEVHGEKVATELTGMLEKVAVDMKLEDLFNARDIRRRQKMWRDKVTGRETKTEGSGFESMEKAKTASVKQDELEVVFGQEPMTKKAEPLSPQDLLRVSNDEKTASHLKWADIVKEIGPDKAVGRVSPLLSDAEPSLPRDTLNAMGEAGLEKGLSTPSMAGMVLKPEEFQRIMLTSMGKGDLADKLDEAGAQFKPSCEMMSPCGSLGPGMMDDGLLEKLLPMIREKSYFGPPVRARIIRITIVKPAPQPAPTEVESPLLSKVAAAYTWYRREQMKLAADALSVVPGHQKLHSALYGLGDSDLFKGAAMVGGVTINPRTLGVILGAVPLTLMYSAHLRGKQRQGEEMGMLKNLVADHPWLATLGTAATLKKVLDTPQGQQAVDEMLAAAGRIWRGKGAPQATL